VVLDHDSWFMAMALRLGVPLGPIYPYTLFGLGYYKDYGNGGGGCLGAGLEWRLGHKLALAADARFHPRQRQSLAPGVRHRHRRRRLQLVKGPVEG
jgi:hypothetical protein